jgi:hypothetical protein
LLVRENNVKHGDKYLLQTATHYYIGRVVEVTPSEVVLDHAAWIPDMGRFHECIARGTVAECEPCPDDVQVRIPRPCIAIQWRHELPREVK